MGFFNRLSDFFTGYEEIDEEFFEDLTDTLIMGDVGMQTSEELVEELKARVRKEKVSDTAGAKKVLTRIMEEKLEAISTERDFEYEDKRSVVLVVGVNGVGKTTSAGKLAARYRALGRKVMLVAADTFRAAAIEQLTAWAMKTGADIVKGREGGDPGSVIYDAIQSAKARDYDMLIVDTAGRLHNKKNLMNELGKINQIIKTEYPEAVKETLVVVDASTGQNAKEQAREFKEVTDVSGVVLTKLDGSAKGGIVIAIENELGIPVKFVGVGEGVSDLRRFDVEKYMEGLVGT
ncbi:MAG TPA: signal recognition particle-docking protein FtsY [Lachnospiraceae bacterium]|nr:signal recognition particle-docking protein FtsY [Lachnospiraceae bacterium]MBQ4241675.1 signal recognition particle-docking protein FtsY [Lachnospiraceae bacterium]MBQ9568205.1 signal recognition particle-docking protein FtsY [Lachnospiraceae bacterium]MCR4785760.1 signal recognition particle-docking protein FtsY [Lachnospiraceae bacterium]HAL31645.1 signal recognition particle-docking protein FtsY [Lachnospiraceae bacterium]